MAAAAMGRNSSTNSLHLDEKWKLSKKESLSRSRSTSSLAKSDSSTSSRRSSQKRCAFTRKCAKLVKEQRARFYIMRRCVTMLICWRDYSDESE
uniref:ROTUNDIFOLIA like 8 n=1 Tax=Kalanchoe fedtschenkoi TaxID=63787 RepID=A0A7N0UT33_KALFE